MTRMEPLVVSVKRKMVIAYVKTVSMVTNVIENVNVILEAQKTQTGVIKTLEFAVAKMDGMDTCVSMSAAAI